MCEKPSLFVGNCLCEEVTYLLTLVINVHLGRIHTPAGFCHHFIWLQY